MNRRTFLTSSAGFAVGASTLASTAIAAEPAHQHHAGGSDGRYSSLATVFAACAATSLDCVAHCQTVLATGDKSMAECLKTSLDCDAICEAVAKLSRFNSDFAPTLAKQSIPVMSACADACKPHIEHHAVCKTCYDACNATIAAAKKA